MRNVALLFFLLALSCSAQTNSLAFDDSAPPPWYHGTNWTNLPIPIQLKIEQGPTTNAPLHWKLVWDEYPNAEYYNIYQSTNARAPLGTWYSIDSCESNSYPLLQWPAKFTNCPACFYIVRPVVNL